jgi:hypothetical protein
VRTCGCREQVGAADRAAFIRLSLDERVDDRVLPGENTLDAAFTSAKIKHSIKRITRDDTRATFRLRDLGLQHWLSAPNPGREL